MTNPIERTTELLRSRIADYTIGLAIALIQAQRARSSHDKQPRTHKPNSVVLAPAVLFVGSEVPGVVSRPLRRSRPRPNRRCASCGSDAPLAVDHEADSGVVFCRDCLDQVAPVDFPEYYLDLGELD